MPKEEKEQQETGSTIVWTCCPKCGDTWSTQAVIIPGKCRVCGGKPKLQKVVF